MKTAVALCWILPMTALPAERVLTHSARGHLIHNTGVFSPDGQYIVFDSRNDETRLADSLCLGVVDVTTGEERLILETGKAGETAPGAGAASFSPVKAEIVFMKGLDDVSAEFPYAVQRRSGMLLDLAANAVPRHLDARDVTPPLVPGALRGGTHAHQWSGDGKWISFTYNDALLPAPGPAPTDLRTVGVTVLGRPVDIASAASGGEFSGSGFSVLVVPVTPHPEAGSDVVSRAYDEGWVGTNGYRKADGTRQERALAFFGDVVAANGKRHSDVFIADLPADLTRAAAGKPLEGSATTRPNPSEGIVIRRITRSGASASPGIQAPRHWIRSSPDGSTIAFLDQDDGGIVQLFTVPAIGGERRQLSRLPASIETPFSWSPDGTRLAFSSGGRVVVLPADGKNAPVYLTERHPDGRHPLHGVVFSPDGKMVAYNRMLRHPDGGDYLQVCLVEVPVSERD